MCARVRVAKHSQMVTERNVTTIYNARMGTSLICGAGSIMRPRFRCIVASFRAIAFATCTGAFCAICSLACCSSDFISSSDTSCSPQAHRVLNLQKLIIPVPITSPSSKLAHSYLWDIRAMVSGRCSHSQSRVGKGGTKPAETLVICAPRMYTPYQCYHSRTSKIVPLHV